MAKQGTNIMPWLVGGFAAWLFWAGKINPFNMPLAFNAAKYTSALRVKVYGVKLQKDRVIFSVSIANPNTRPLPVTAVVGDIWVTGTDTGTKRPIEIHLGTVAQYPKGFTIKPESTSDIQITVQLKAIEAISYIVRLLTQPLINQAFWFKGTVTADGRTWPINEGIRI